MFLHTQEFAQRAIVAYLRSEFLQPDKAVHDVAALPAEELAQSWGLLTAPRLRFLKKVELVHFLFGSCLPVPDSVTDSDLHLCVRVCVCVRACVHACVRVCVYA